MKATKERISIKRVRQLMGQLVVVTKYLWATSEQSGDWTYRAAVLPPRTGWVTGIRWYCDRSGGRYGKPTGKAIPCLLVAFWPSQNPVKAPLDGWRRYRVDGQDPLPWDGQWDTKERILAAEDANNAPRDAQGRFV